jgi:phosphoglycerate dehydrogenase-like enzyme
MDLDRPLEDQVGEIDALIPSMSRITAAVIAAAPKLRLIVQYGAGLDGVDKDAAAARGIPVRNVPGVNAQAVAELALYLMLALARRVPQHQKSFRDRVVGAPSGTELAGKTLGIVGLGASGRALAGIARAMGMEVLAIRRTPAADSDASWVGGPDEIDQLLARSDFVSLHVPTSAETRGLMNAARLARMKPTAFLVNVGRGDLVDRDALLDALRQKRIAGVGLDVYWTEPPDPGDPLFALDNVVATPHIGGATDEAYEAIGARVLAILTETLTGAPRA